MLSEADLDKLESKAKYFVSVALPQARVMSAEQVLPLIAAAREGLRLNLTCAKCGFVLDQGITQDGCCGCEIEKLRGQLAAAQADAERWRWCVDNGFPTRFGSRWQGDARISSPAFPTAEAAVDAARAEQRQP